MLKSFPKILTIIFLIIFIFQLACLLFLTLAPSASQAADIKFTPQVQGLDYTFDAADKSTGNIARYVRAIYKYAIGIVGILAAVVLMIGGVMWIVAGGNATAIGEAKSWIGASLTGLVIALCSYLILATINPDLVNLKTTGIKTVEDSSSGCCEKGGANQGVTTQTECTKNGGTWGGKNSVWSDIYKKCISDTTSNDSTGCCFNSSTSPKCKDTTKAYCPSTATFYPVACNTPSISTNCGSSASCAGQSNGTSCTVPAPQSGVTYQCNNGSCEPCRGSGMACGSLRCCVGNCIAGANICP